MYESCSESILLCTLYIDIKQPSGNASTRTETQYDL